MTTSRKSSRRHSPARRRRLNRIKAGYTYDVAETAVLIGVHPNTVRRWLKDGLSSLDDRRPLLIHGAALKAFLAKQRDDRRSECAPGQFFCFRCKAPRNPKIGSVNTIDHGPNVVRLTACCGACGIAMHRTASRQKLPQALDAISRLQMERRRIRAPFNAS